MYHFITITILILSQTFSSRCNKLVWTSLMSFGYSNSFEFTWGDTLFMILRNVNFDLMSCSISSKELRFISFGVGLSNYIRDSTKVHRFFLHCIFYWTMSCVQFYGLSNIWLTPFIISFRRVWILSWTKIYWISVNLSERTKVLLSLNLYSV